MAAMIPRCRLLLPALLLVSLPLLPPAPGRAEPPPQKLPKVLLIGDSISIGYAPNVQKLLEGQAEVVHHEGNAQDTRTGLKMLDGWLGDTKWDAIHFNWGLWDLKGQADGTTVVPQDEYEKNLRTLVERLKKTGAKLTWASTTPVPEMNAQKRTPENVVKFNDIAAWVMKDNNIPIDDLHARMLPNRQKYESKPNDVHFSKEGSRFLAETVAASVRKELRLPEPKKD